MAVGRHAPTAPHHLGGHQLQEVGEVDDAGAVLVDLADHLLDLLPRRLEAQRAHRHLQLLRVNSACGRAAARVVLGCVHIGPRLPRRPVGSAPSSPLPSVSKRSKASLISAFCSSVSSNRPAFLPALAREACAIGDVEGHGPVSLLPHASERANRRPAGKQPRA
jgi:hypothetical protein